MVFFFGLLFGRFFLFVFLVVLFFLVGLFFLFGFLFWWFCFGLFVVGNTVLYKAVFQHSTTCSVEVEAAKQLESLNFGYATL